MILTFPFELGRVGDWLVLITFHVFFVHHAKLIVLLWTLISIVGKRLIVILYFTHDAFVVLSKNVRLLVS